MENKKIFFWIILSAILIRIPLLFLNPITMWTDPSFRYLPNTYDVLQGDFSFYTPPLLMVMNALPTIFLNGFILEFFWKLIPFIFFILSVLVFVKILKIIELKKEGKIFLLFLFLFNIYSILMSTSIMLEMPTLFFSLVLFYFLEKNEKMNLKLFFIIAISTTLLLYSKQTGYFILAGFFLYALFMKTDKKQKKLILIALALGFLLNTPWIIKNQIQYGSFLSGGYGEAGTIKQSLVSFENPLPLISGIFHAGYRIPSLNQLNYSGIFYILSRLYYFLFVTISLLLTFAIFMGIVKFGKKYKKYILMILPTFLLVFFFAFFYFMHYTHDFGRYMFSFYFLFFFFGLKYIESFKKTNWRRFFYCIIILFCVLSLVTSYAMSYELHNKDKEIREINKFISSKDGTFLANDHYTKWALTFYSGKKILPLEEGEICGEGEKIFANNKYQIFLEKNSYKICLT